MFSGQIIKIIEDRNNILKKNLFGFRKAFSKSDTVIELLTELHDKIDEAGDTMCLFYDMTKAFNDFAISLKKN